MPPSPSHQSAHTLREFLSAHLEGRRAHAKSLVSTFFGDVVIPNDGYTWVETICAAMDPLGMSDRLVRTSLFRLREEAWLQPTRSGRKSYYRLTEHAKRQTALAEKLIYHRDSPVWDGSWTMVFLVLGKVVGDIDAEIKQKFIQQLHWIGFGSVSKGVWAYPGSNANMVGELINQLNLQGKVICMACENIHNRQLGLPIDDRVLAAQCMPVADIEARYKRFISAYSLLLNSKGEMRLKGSSTELLSLRLLMVDEFRRIILKDPHLPAELLPPDWAGDTAFNLCGAIYQQIFELTNIEYLGLQKNAGRPENLSVSQFNKSDYQSRFSLI